MGQGGGRQQLGIGRPARRQGQGAKPTRIARQNIPEAGAGHGTGRLAQLPAAAIGGGHHRAGPLEQHGGATGAGGGDGGLQGGQAGQFWKQPGEFAGMGRNPAGAQPAAQPGRWADAKLPGDRPCQAVETIGIQQQQGRRTLQGLPKVELGARDFFIHASFFTNSRADAGPQHQGIESLQISALQFAEGEAAGRAAGQAALDHHLGLRLPQTSRHGLGQGGPHTAATAGGGPGQGQGGGAAIAVAAGHHQQSATAVFAQGGIEGQARQRRQIGRGQGQGLLLRQAIQQGPGQSQIDALQLPHPAEGLVLHQTGLDQTDRVGGAGPGRHRPQQPAAVGAEARGYIHRHQGGGLQPLPLRQQGFNGGSGGAPLADAKQGVDPQGRPLGRRWLRQPLDAQPERMAPMAGGERFVPAKWTPNRGGHPRQLQLPGDHQPVAAVMARSHQHQGPMAAQPLAMVRQQSPTHRQGRLFHQRLHRQATGEQLLLQLGHLAAAHQQMVGIAAGPGRQGSRQVGVW